MRFTHAIPILALLQQSPPPSISAFSTPKLSFRSTSNRKSYDVVLRAGNASPNDVSVGNHHFDDLLVEHFDADMSASVEGDNGIPCHHRSSHATENRMGVSWVAGLVGVASSQLHVTKALAEGTVGLAAVLLTGITDGDVATVDIPKEAIIELSASSASASSIVVDKDSTAAPQTMPPSAITTLTDITPNSEESDAVTKAAVEVTVKTKEIPTADTTTTLDTTTADQAIVTMDKAAADNSKISTAIQNIEKQSLKIEEAKMRAFKSSEKAAALKTTLAEMKADMDNNSKPISKEESAKLKSALEADDNSKVPGENAISIVEESNNGVGAGINNNIIKLLEEKAIPIVEESNNGDVRVKEKVAAMKAAKAREKAAELKTMLAKLGAVIKDNIKLISKEKAISMVEQSNDGNANEALEDVALLAVPAVIIAGIVSSASSMLSADNEDTASIEPDAVDDAAAKKGATEGKSDTSVPYGLRNNTPDYSMPSQVMDSNKEDNTSKTS